MDITEWNNDEIMRLVMAKGHITQKVLLEKLKQETGATIPQSTFSCKLRRNSLKLESSRFFIVGAALLFLINPSP